MPTPEFCRRLPDLGRFPERLQGLLVVVSVVRCLAVLLPGCGTLGCHLDGVSGAFHSFRVAVQVAQSHGLQQPEIRRGLAQFGRLAECGKRLLVVALTAHGPTQERPSHGGVRLSLDQRARVALSLCNSPQLQQFGNIDLSIPVAPGSHM